MSRAGAQVLTLIVRAMPRPKAGRGRELLSIVRAMPRPKAGRGRELLLILAATGSAAAGPVTAKLELPAAPARAPIAGKGFLDRIENPRKPVQPVAVTPHLLVVLEGEPKPEGSPQVVWELVGESFARPVIGAPVGAEVLIKNTSQTSRTLIAVEDPKLLSPGPINPTGPKSFKVPAARVYTITDPDAPHLRGRVVVVATPYVAPVDAAGKVDFGDVAEGAYKVRVFFRDHWIDRPEQSVTVPARGKLEIDVKIPAGYPLKK
jgi:hypothetical protein